MLDENRFEQRRLANLMKFRLVHDGVEVIDRGLITSSKYKVPFEAISLEPREATVSSSFRFWATVVFFGLAAIMGISTLVGQDTPASTSLIYALFGLGFATTYLMSRAKFLIYDDAVETKRPLIVYENKPSPAALESFIEKVQNKKREYLRMNHLLRNEVGAGVDAIHKLTWLLGMGAISEEEFAKLKADVIQGARWGGISPPSGN